MRRKFKHEDDEADVDMTPMLDIVFIMLIFFIVTTSFTKESGVEVNRPANQPESEKENKIIPIMFVIDQNDIITMRGREIDFRAVGANVEREKAKHPKSAVIVNVHPESSTDMLVKVVNAAREAGVEQVNVSTAAVTTR